MRLSSSQLRSPVICAALPRIFRKLQMIMTSAITAPICADALTARTPNNTTDDTTMEVIQMKFNYNKTRATINDKYQTAKWNARQSVQRTKDRIRAEVVKPRKPIKLPF